MGFSDETVIGNCDKITKCLLDHGRSIGPFMPWHHSNDPYQWLLAEIFLRKTTRKAANEVFQDMVSICSNWEELNKMSEKDIASKIQRLGLFNQRSKQIKALTSTVVEKHNGLVPCKKEELMELPGVGRYVADAMTLYVCGNKAFPLDVSIQRVFRRVLGFPITTNTRRSEPYRDPLLASLVSCIIETYPRENLLNIHRGILHVAWENCKLHSDCPDCPLKVVCKCAAQTI